MNGNGGGAGFFELGAVAQGSPAPLPNALPQTSLKLHPVRAVASKSSESRTKAGGGPKAKAAVPSNSATVESMKDDDELKGVLLSWLFWFVLFLIVAYVAALAGL